MYSMFEESTDTGYGSEHIDALGALSYIQKIESLNSNEGI